MMKLETDFMKDIIYQKEFIKILVWASYKKNLLYMKNSFWNVNANKPWTEHTLKVKQQI